MNLKLVLKWIAVLVLGSIAWVALGLGHSLFDFADMVAGMVCALFILDCVEKATGRPAYFYAFLLVAVGVDVILVHVHTPETAGIPIALIVAWMLDDFMLRYSAAKQIRKLKEKGNAA